MRNQSFRRPAAIFVAVGLLVCTMWATLSCEYCTGDRNETAPTPASSSPARRTLPCSAEGPTLHDRAMAAWRVQQLAAAAEQDTPSPDQKSSALSPGSSTDASNNVLTGTSSDVLADTSPNRLVLTNGQTPLQGRWPGSAEQLSSYLVAAYGTPSFTVPVDKLAYYYLHYCNEAGLRADLLWAQMIYETGGGLFGGIVKPEQNNFAGLGATGPNEEGLWFSTAEDGVMAHVAHMVAYVYSESPVGWANPAVDPRFGLVQPRGQAKILADLNGRWALPGTNYGQAIEEIARLLNVLAGH